MSAPGADFETFLQGLAASALLHLGAIPNPDTRQSEPNLPLARHTIDLLCMLRQKTAGNLTGPEDELFARILRDVQVRYVQLTRPAS